MVASSDSVSDWGATVDTSDPDNVHVQLTKTEIKSSTAVDVGGKIVVTPAGKEQMTSTKQSTPTPVQTLRQKTESRIEEWTEGMVYTAGTQAITDKILQGKTWLVVTGSPGEGKTTAAYLALKQLHGMGRHVYEVRTPEEYFKVKDNKGSIIMLNDIFGSCQFNTGNLEIWRIVLNDVFELKVHTSLKAFRGSLKRDTCVILVIRTSVLISAADHLEKFKNLFLDSESVVNLTQDITVSQEERFAIWRYHADMYKMNIDEKTVRHVLVMSLSHGFPHCCRLFAGMYTKNKNSSMESFFSKPIEFLNQRMTSLLADSTAGPLLREMMKHDGCLELNSIADDERRYQYKTVVERYRGTYLSEEDNTVKFHHPSVYDSAAFVVCTNDPLFAVRHFSLSFLNERVRFTGLVSQNETETLLTISIASKYIETYIERLKTEISQGNISLALSHVSFHIDNFTERFMEALYSNSSGLLKSDFILGLMHQCDRKSKQSFLFHSTVNKSALVLKYICNLVDLSPEDQAESLFGICEYSSISGLNFLLNKYENISLNVRNSNFETPLLVASTKASAQMLVALLQKDVDVTVRDKKGCSALFYICKYGLEGGGDVVKMLIDKNRDFDGKSEEFRNGKTALNYASIGGHVDVITALIDRGVDMNLTNKFGQTPLHYACLRGHVNAMKALIDSGVDINQTNKYGHSPLHYACRKGSMNALPTLLDTGVDINKRSNDGQTPLHYACHRGNANAMTALIDRGVDINQTDSDGRSAMHIASLNGDMNIITALIDKAADINQTDSHGATPLHYACDWGRVNVMTALIDRGVDINQTDNNGQTPLHYVCVRGHLNVMTALIDRGVDINQTDNDGKTPFTMHVFEDV